MAVQEIYTKLETRTDLFPTKMIIAITLTLTIMLLGEECPRLHDPCKYRHIRGIFLRCSNLQTKEARMRTSELFDDIKGFLLTLMVSDLTSFMDDNEPTLLIQSKTDIDETAKHKAIELINQKLDGSLHLSDFNPEAIANTALNQLHNPDPHPTSNILQEDLQLTSSDEEVDPANDKTTLTEQPTKLPNKDNPMNIPKTNPTSEPNPPTSMNEPPNIEAQPKKPIYDEEKRQYKCPNCLKHYQKNKWKLTRHLNFCQEKSKYKIFKCNICHRGFTTKWNLKRHQEKDCKKMY